MLGLRASWNEGMERGVCDPAVPPPSPPPSLQLGPRYFRRFRRSEHLGFVRGERWEGKLMRGGRHQHTSSPDQGHGFTPSSGDKIKERLESPSD